MSQTAWLIVGHGTRNPEGARQLLELVEHMKRLEPGQRMEACFLELANPNIPDAIASLASQGVRRLLVIPVLLFQAGHAKSDIPNAVESAASVHGIEVIGQTPSLGTTESLVQLSQLRFEQAIDTTMIHSNPARCPMVRCKAGECRLIGSQLGTLGLAMVGRGASDIQALEHMRELTRLRASIREREGRPFAWFDTGFFACGSPNVDRLLELASITDCDTIVVQPHLLFEGELIEQLRAKVMEKQSSHPNKRWIIANVLGEDASLAQVFVGFGNEAMSTQR